MIERVGEVTTLIGVGVGRVGCSTTTLGVVVVVTRDLGRVTCGVVEAGPFRVAMNVSAPFLRVPGIDVMLFQMEMARSLVLVKDCFVLSRIVLVKDTHPSDIPLEAPKSESPPAFAPCSSEVKTEAVVARPRSLVDENALPT